MNQPRTNFNPMSRGEFEAEFYRLLGRLVFAHSLFDRNVGSQLYWFGRWYGNDVLELLDPKKTPFSKRLKALRRMVLDIFEPSGSKGLTEFEDLFKRASTTTALRNDYVHGCWSWHYHESGRYMILQFSPLHWEMMLDHPDTPLNMELGEFAEQVKDAEGVLLQYHRLIEKYRRFAKKPP